jgi:iron complex outermembrane recepter protein
MDTRIRIEARVALKSCAGVVALIMTFGVPHLAVALPAPADTQQTESSDQGENASAPPAASQRAHERESASETELTEVVVTAERRTETVDKVPMSLTALSQKALDDLHLQSLSDLATVVPGLVFAPTGGISQGVNDVAIRGVFSGGNAATTGIYIDETPVTSRPNYAIAFSGSTYPDIFDLDRIEVLRGPQGTLFGSGAMGGAIRFITPQPSLDGASGYAKVEVGFTDSGSPSYAAGLAFGDSIVPGEAGFRVSGWFHWDGGFIDIEDPYSGQTVRRNANSADAYVFRPAFTWQPTEGLTITPAAFLQHDRSDEPDNYWVTELPSPQSGQYVSGNGAVIAQPATDELEVYSLAIKYLFRGLALQSDTSYTYRNGTNIDDWSNELQSEPPFSLPPLDPALASFHPYDEDIAWTRAWQQEFRLSSEDSSARLNWVVGLFFRHDLEGISQLIWPDLTPATEAAFGQTSFQYYGVPDYVYKGQVLNSYTWSSTITEQKAFFGEVSYEVLPRIKANVGVRVERASVEAQQQVFAGPLDDVAYTRTPLPDQAQTPITPRFGLTYQYTDQDMIYATAAKGYRSGGSNTLLANEDPLCRPSLTALGLQSAPVTFDSDSLWSYEVGAKSSLFDRRLSFQASAFYIDWTGIQTTLFLPSCGELFTTNRGKVISQGFDLQFAAVLMQGLKLGGSVGYADAYHPDALFGAPVNGVPPLLVGAGDKVAGAPPWTAAANLEYSRSIDRLWADTRSYLRVDYRWIDAYPKGDPNVAGYDPGVESVPGYPETYPNQAYGLLNVRVGVVHEGLDVSAFVKNATNSSPLLDVFHWAIGDPLYTAQAIRPRTVGITATYAF